MCETHPDSIIVLGRIWSLTSICSANISYMELHSSLSDAALDITSSASSDVPKETTSWAPVEGRMLASIKYTGEDSSGGQGAQGHRADGGLSLPPERICFFYGLARVIDWSQEPSTSARRVRRERRIHSALSQRWRDLGRKQQLWCALSLRGSPKEEQVSPSLSATDAMLSEPNSKRNSKSPWS